MKVTAGAAERRGKKKAGGGGPPQERKGKTELWEMTGRGESDNGR